MKNWKQNSDIQIICYVIWKVAHVPLISLDYLWDVSTPWLESACGKFNWFDMMRKDTVHQFRQFIHQKSNYEVEGTDFRVQRHDCVEAQATKTFLLHWKFPRAQWPPYFFNERNLEQPGLFLELGKERGKCGDQETDGYCGWAPEILCGNGRSFQKDNDHCSTPLICALWECGQTEASPQQKFAKST